MRRFSDGELLELYREGLTNREIADRLQVRQPSVQYRLGKLGLVNNSCKESVDVQQVEILHGLGLTTVGIAFFQKSNVRVVIRCMKELALTENDCRLKKLISDKKGGVK